MNSFAHIAFTVKDMKATMDFYEKCFGFKKAFDLKHPVTGAPWIEYISMNNGEFIELFYDGTVENPYADEKIGFSHLCVKVDDMDAIVKQIKDAGYTLDIEPNVGADLNTQAWIHDPDGIRIELMQFDPNCPQMKYMKG